MLLHLQYQTMETGGKKMIYQWNDDLNIVTQQTEEPKRARLMSVLSLP
jgi:hypothetical protein